MAREKYDEIKRSIIALNDNHAQDQPPYVHLMTEITELAEKHDLLGVYLKDFFYNTPKLNKKKLRELVELVENTTFIKYGQPNLELFEQMVKDDIESKHKAFNYALIADIAPDYWHKLLRGLRPSQTLTSSEEKLSGYNNFQAEILWKQLEILELDMAKPNIQKKFPQIIDSIKDKFSELGNAPAAQAGIAYCEAASLLFDKKIDAGQALEQVREVLAVYDHPMLKIAEARYLSQSDTSPENLQESIKKANALVQEYPDLEKLAAPILQHASENLAMVLGADFDKKLTELLNQNKEQAHEAALAAFERDETSRKAQRSMLGGLWEGITGSPNDPPELEKISDKEQQNIDLIAEKIAHILKNSKKFNGLCINEKDNELAAKIIDAHKEEILKLLEHPNLQQEKSLDERIARIVDESMNSLMPKKKAKQLAKGKPKALDNDIIIPSKYKHGTVIQELKKVIPELQKQDKRELVDPKIEYMKEKRAELVESQKNYKQLTDDLERRQKDLSSKNTQFVELRTTLIKDLNIAILKTKEIRRLYYNYKKDNLTPDDFDTLKQYDEEAEELTAQLQVIRKIKPEEIKQKKVKDEELYNIDLATVKDPSVAKTKSKFAEEIAREEKKLEEVKQKYSNLLATAQQLRLISANFAASREQMQSKQAELEALKIQQAERRTEKAELSKKAIEAKAKAAKESNVKPKAPSMPEPTVVPVDKSKVKTYAQALQDKVSKKQDKKAPKAFVTLQQIPLDPAPFKPVQSVVVTKELSPAERRAKGAPIKAEYQRLDREHKQNIQDTMVNIAKENLHYYASDNKKFSKKLSMLVKKYLNTEVAGVKKGEFLRNIFDSKYKEMLPEFINGTRDDKIIAAIKDYGNEEYGEMIYPIVEALSSDKSFKHDMDKLLVEAVREREMPELLKDQLHPTTLESIKNWLLRRNIPQEYLDKATGHDQSEREIDVAVIESKQQEMLSGNPADQLVRNSKQLIATIAGIAEVFSDELKSNEENPEGLRVVIGRLNNQLSQTVEKSLADCGIDFNLVGNKEKLKSGITNLCEAMEKEHSGVTISKSVGKIGILKSIMDYVIIPILPGVSYYMRDELEKEYKEKMTSFIKEEMKNTQVEKYGDVAKFSPKRLEERAARKDARDIF